MNIDRILLIDDSEIDNMVNKRVIEKCGLTKEVIVEQSAQQGIDYLKSIDENRAEDLPDIIFLDIRMPDIDGFGFLELFRNLPEYIHNRVNIVMLSSSIDSEDYRKANESKFVKDYINKPLKKEVIEKLHNS